MNISGVNGDPLKFNSLYLPGNEPIKSEAGGPEGIEMVPLGQAPEIENGGENRVDRLHEDVQQVDESGGVGNLRNVLGPDNESVEQNPIAGTGGGNSKRIYDMSKTSDVREVVERSIKGVREKILDYPQMDEKLAKLREKRDAEMDQVKKSKLDSAIKKLEDIASQYRAKCEEVTELLSCKRKEPTEDELAHETSEQREARLRKDIDDMRVSFRNFRSDFNKTIHAKSGVFARVTRAVTFVRNLFTTTRNRFFGWIVGEKQQYVPKNGFKDLQELGTRFDDFYYGAINGHDPDDGLDAYISRGAVPKEDPGFVDALDDLDDFMVSVTEMIEKKTSDSLANMCFNSVKSQLRNIAANGGHKVMVLELGVGFGVHVTDNAELVVGGKGQYIYTVSGKGDGSVTVEHVGGGGLGASAKFRVGDLLKVNADGELLGMGGKSTTYRDLDAATRALGEGKMARINPLFIKNRGIGTNVKFGLKYLGAALVFLPKLALKGVDALHKLRTGHHLLDMFDPVKRYSDRKYFTGLEDRKVMTKADRLLTPHKNIGISEKRTFGRIQAGLGGRIAFHLGVKMTLDNSVEAHEDLHAKKTEYRTYMTYLTSEQNGRVTENYLKIPTDDPRHGLDDAERVAQLLKRDPGDDVEEQKLLAKDILNEVAVMIEREDDLAKETADEIDAKGYAGYGDLAARYRTGMMALAALFEKFDSLKNVDADIAKTFEGAREAATANFENPGVKFPDDLFQEKFFTQHTTPDGRIVTKHEHVFEYDMLGDLKTHMLTDTKLADSKSGKGGFGDAFGNFGKTAGRSGSMGAVEGAQKAAGFKGFVGVTVTEEAPTQSSEKPWRNQNRKTIDLMLSANAPFDVIMRAYVQTLCNEAGIKMPEDGNWKEMISNGVIGTLVSAGTQLVTDLYEKFSGKNVDESLKESGKNWVAGSVLDTWQTGRTLRFEIQDGRLNAISLGNGEKFKVKYSKQVGPVVISGGATFNTIDNTNSFWNAPSFDALLGKCDDYLRNGNRAEWKLFASRNDTGFARLCDIFARCCNKTPIQLDQAGKSLDPNELDDRKRIERFLDRINQEASQAAEKTKGALADNIGKLLQAMDAVTEASEKGDTSAKALAMRTFLELAVRHYDIVADDGSEIEMLDTMATGWLDVEKEGDGEEDAKVVATVASGPARHEEAEWLILP